MPLLIQCTLTALKEKDSYFAIKYNRIKKRCGHKRDIITIAYLKFQRSDLTALLKKTQTSKTGPLTSN